MRVDDYMTSEDCYIIKPDATTIDQMITLPAGTFVKPIEPYYLPDHIKNSDDYASFSPKTQVYVYCHYGIVAIPRRVLRKA